MARAGRETWMLVGIGFNTITSLTAIALWVVAPPRSGASRGPSSEAVSATMPRPQAQPVMPPRRPLPTPEPGPAAAPPSGDEVLTDAPAPPVITRLSQRQGQGEATVKASVVALGESLHLDPQVLTDQLGDEHGEVSRSAAARLERGFKTGEALAKRLDLDESKTQSLVALFTYHVFSVLREEKQAAPGSVDPARIDELTESLLNDVRVTCGEAIAADAKSAIAGL